VLDMRSPLQTSFGAIFKNEVLLNSKRVAPYALIVLFTAHAVLWWGWSAAATYGWATNGDFNIVRNLQGFSFILGLPLFTAVMMGDPVIRDFRIGIDPLIFSKPVNRAAYLMGKFWSNFFVLVCCQAAFALTMLVLQWFPTSRLVVLPVRVFPYFKHFFFFVVVSHLFLAAVYFTIGTLTRNAKIVYGAAVAFYPLYLAYQVLLLKSLSPRWRTVLDPMLLNSGNIPRVKWEDAAWVNQIVVRYSADMMLNRGVMLAAAAVFLIILCFRFAKTTSDRSPEMFSVLNISTADERIFYDGETILAARSNESPDLEAALRPHSVQLPAVATRNEGLNANLRKLLAATLVELRLLCSERSLVVLIPLAMLLSFLALPFSRDVSGVSHSAAFASSTAKGLLLFLLGVIVFYIGEAMHRDREVRVEPILWSKPVPNSVLLLPQFMATLLLTLVLLVLVGMTAMLTQLLRGQTPIEISAYLITYSVILVPSLAFIAAACIALNVLLRDKYLTYAFTIAVASGLFYLYGRGYNHWLYNPVLYGLWTETDLTGPGALVSNIVTLRLYCVGLTLLSLLLAHFFFQRPGSIRRLRRLHRFKYKANDITDGSGSDRGR
jgi:ABC-2 type transport system permease protein